MNKFAKSTLVIVFSLLALSVGFSQMPAGPMSAEKITDNIYIVKG